MDLSFGAHEPPFTWKWRPAQVLHRFASLFTGAPGKEISNLFTAIDLYARRALDAVRLEAESTLNSVLDDLRKRLEERNKEVQRLFDDSKDDQPRQDALAELARQVNEVAEKAAQSSASGTGDIQLRLARSQQKPSGGQCLICEHLTEVTFEFMRHYQYRLLTDPKERSDNAARGGMCSFHTWMYESFGSPQGICAGYGVVLIAASQKVENSRGLRLIAASRSLSFVRKIGD